MEESEGHGRGWEGEEAHCDGFVVVWCGDMSLGIVRSCSERDETPRYCICGDANGSKIMVLGTRVGWKHVLTGVMGIVCSV